MVNKGRLLAEIEFIKSLPDEDAVKRDEAGDPVEDYWRQRTWWVRHGEDGEEAGCGSAGCLAGWALHRAGAKLSVSGTKVRASTLPEELRTALGVTGPDTAVSYEVPTQQAAAMYFGLERWQADDLFHQDNDIERIERLAAYYIAVAEAAALA